MNKGNPMRSSMLRRMTGMAALAGAALLSTHSGAWAAGVLDQENGFTTDSGLAPFASKFASDSGGFRRVQTVTVGLSGLLTRIEIGLGRNSGFAGDPSDEQFLEAVSDLDVSTWTGPDANTAGAPGSVLIDNAKGVDFQRVASLDAGFTFLVTGWVGYDVSGAGIMVSAGDVITLELVPNEGNRNSAYAYSQTDDYAGGSGYYKSAAGSAFNSESDHVFRTYVTQPVPEPESWALMGVGLGVLSWAGRRLRKASV